MLSEEQQRIRATGIGGSEIAAVAGLNPWCGPHEIWLRKTGRGGDVPSSHHIERGRFLEPSLIRWYAHRTGSDVTVGETLRHPEHPIVIATPDALTPTRVVEFKAPSRHTAHEWNPDTGEIPEQYYPQVMWEMAVTGRQLADVVAYLDDDLQIYPVPFMPQMFARLLRRAERFWNNYVLTDTPPPIDGTDSAREFLRAMYPRACGDVIPCPADVQAWVSKYQSARVAREKAEAAEREARNHIEAAIGAHDGVDGEWGCITYRNNKDSVKINYKAVCEHLKPPADVIERFTMVRPGPRVFRARFNTEQNLK